MVRYDRIPWLESEITPYSHVILHDDEEELPTHAANGLPILRVHLEIGDVVTGQIGTQEERIAAWLVSANEG